MRNSHPTHVLNYMVNQIQIQINKDSNEKSLLVKNSTEQKDIIKVGDAVMSDVTASAERLVNRSFEANTIGLDAHMDNWDGRVINDDAIIIGGNTYIESWVTSSNAYADGGGKHYQILFSFSFLVASWVAVIWYYKKGSQNEDSNFTTEKISFNDTYPF